jgi:hypothetical protein
MVVRRRRNKYGNIKTVVDGRSFHSKKEAARYLVLKEMEQRGEIANLRLQVSHTITVNGHKICRYVSDFEYDLEDRHIVEDVKTERTAKLPVYRLKKKLLKACLGIDIDEYI